MKHILLLCLLLCSCGLSNKYLVTEHYDQFDQVRTITLSNNYLAAETAEIALSNLIDLKVSKVIKPDTTLLVLAVFHSGDSRFILENDEPLVMLIDGKRYDFEQLWAKHGAIERGYYGVSPEQFYQLAFAKSVSVKISGADYNIVRSINPVTLARYQRFYAEYLK